MVPARLPSPRTAVASALAPLALAASPAAAQSWTESTLEPAISLPLQFGVALVVNLVLCGVVYALAPQYVARMVARVRDGPGESFLFGLVASVACVVAAVLLAITIVGLVLVVPGVIVLALVQLVGSAVGTVALGAALSGRDAGGGALFVGALALSATSVVPVLGGLVQFLVSTAGFGAVVGAYWENR